MLKLIENIIREQEWGIVSKTSEEEQLETI
jgi:hypothetical protein